MEVRKEEWLKFISKKTDDGRTTGRISFYCKALEVTRQAFYDHLSHKNAPWKYQALADEMMKIHEEDQYNDCYGRERMYLALQQRKTAGKTDIDIPCEATVRKVMVQIGLIHKPRRKPNGITKADRLARKSDDLLRRDFYADRPLKKAVTDIREVKANDGKLYVSVMFDCFCSTSLSCYIFVGFQRLPYNFEQTKSYNARISSSPLRHSATRDITVFLSGRTIEI